MINQRTNQIKRNIIMVIGAIVVVIILVYAYLEITSEKPTQQYLQNIKEELQVKNPGGNWAIEIIFLEQKKNIEKDLWIMK